MRHRLYLSSFVLLLLLLSGCGDEPGAETRIMVSIRNLQAQMEWDGLWRAP